MFKSLTSAVVLGLVVASAMAGFDHSQQDSLLRLILVLPLCPGFVAGLFLSGHGGNTKVEDVSCWVVDTGLYWGIWILLSQQIWPRLRREVDKSRD